MAAKKRSKRLLETWLGMETMLRAFLLAPGAATFYGEKNDMPAFGKKLGETELARLVTFLRAQRER